MSRNHSVALGLVALLALACAGSAPGPRAVEGRIDLSRFDFSAGNADLSGTWSVCWGQLLEPGDLCPDGWQPVGVRGLWSDDSARSPFGGKGVATYRLAVQLPPSERSLVLRAGAPMSAYRLWIEGEDSGGMGTVGSSAETTSNDPRRNRVFALPAGAAEVDLWVQLASFDFRGGGIRRPWFVGRPDAVQQAIGQALLRDALLCAISLVVGLAYLVQFALRPRESARGYLGLFALVIAMRSIPGSISDFSQLLVPWASLTTLIRFEYLGTSLVMFAGAGYFCVKVPGTVPPRIMRFVQLVALALVPIDLLAPVSTVLATLPVVLVLAPSVMGLVLFGFGRAWWRGAPDVAVTLVASIVFSFGVLHDVARTTLTDFGFQIELFGYLMTVWILAEAVEMAQVFVRTFERAETLSDELAEANFELQETESAVARFVPFDFLTLLGKSSVREIATGDHVRAEMSVMHCEIRVGDGSSDEPCFRAINDCVRHLEPCIYHNGGFVNAFSGEGLQALFPGGPDAATRAALELRQAVGALRQEPGAARLEVGIGIDTGTLLLGTLGDDEHLVSSVVGPAIATAAAVAALTRDGEARILVSDATRAGLRDDCYHLREHAARLHADATGRKAAAVYEVVAPASSAG